MNKIFFSGHSGVGKTTLINSLVQKYPDKIVKFYFGEEMKKIAVEKGILNTDGFLHDLDPHLRKEIQDIAKQKLIQISNNNSQTLFLVDGHFMIMSNSYYVRSLLDSEIDDYDIYILLTSNPNEIFKRISKDTKNRFDSILSLEEIGEKIELERMELEKITTKFNKPFYIVENNNLDLAIKRVKKILRKEFI